MSSIGASWPELRGQVRRLLAFIVVALLGGAAGMALLLSFPPEAFEAIVPWLIAFASVALLARPWLQRRRSEVFDGNPPDDGSGAD